MSGIARGFNTGFRLADMVAREDESNRRFGLQQDRLDRQEEEGARRYALQQQRLDKQDARAQAQFEMNQEQNEYAKSRRPFQEQKEATLFNLQTQQSQAAMEQARLNIKDKKKTMQRADIVDAYGVANKEFEESGKISPETFQRIAQVSGNTAFDPSTFADQEYIQATDFLSNVAQFGFKDVDMDKLTNSVNKVFKPQINKVNVADGAAYNRITNAKVFKDGAIRFELTGYDKDGNVLKSKWHDKVVPYSDLVDSTMARKTILASVIANPRFHSQMKYLASQNPTKYGQGDKTLMNNISYAQKIYGEAVDDFEKNKRAIYKQYDGAMMSAEDKEKAIAKDLAQLEKDHYLKLGGLIESFAPDELANARLPVKQIKQALQKYLGQSGGGLSGGQGQGSTQGQSFDDEMKAFLEKRGLQQAS